MPGSSTAARSGLLFGLGAYLLWGGFPLYFLLLRPTGAIELVAWRVVFSLAFCLILISIIRAWRPLLAVLRRPRTVLTIGLAAVFIFVNWLVYVYAVLSGNVLEASLGYFLNPIVTVLLGVLVLRERLRPLQWIAVGICLVAVVVIAVAYGQVPWIALALAFSFGLYGLVKKRIGATVDAISGLALETAWLVPVAVVMLTLVGATSVFGTSGITLGRNGTIHTLLLLGVGVITAVALLLFASASRRLTLVSIGLLQFLTPILQFFVGYFFLHEAMPVARWFGFGLVWLGLAVLSIDIVRQGRVAR